MGKLNMFAISLENTAGVFYAGTIMSGHVIIDLKESMPMRGIQLNFSGKAYVHWTEQRTNNNGQTRQTITEHYSASEKYFDQNVLLYGIWSGQGSSRSELLPGRHTFPFQFQLPHGLPSSFEGEHGHVRYIVSCKIDKPWKFDDKTKRPFTIISILDLNQAPDALSRVEGCNQKNLCCLCCKSGPIEATFCVERKGYVPGEAIKLYADISNGSSRRLDKSFVQLFMCVTFHSTRKSKNTRRRVAMLSRPAIAEHSEDVWSGEQLVIPPLPPSFLLGCTIIDVHYVLQLNVDPSGMAIDLKVPLDVVIGTIPLRSVVEQYPPLPPPMGFGASNALAPSAPPPELGTAPPFPHMPPPSYNECITGKVNIRGEDDEHTQGDLNFAPAYTYYNWGHTPAPL